MSPLPLPPPPRFGAAPLPAAMELRLARRGARAFAPRGPGGDVRVTLPEVDAAETVLVPRGFGHPLPARRVGSALRAEPGGEPCAPARWVPAGGVAARLRAVPTPRGPTVAVEPLPAGGGEGPWVCVRPAALAWSAARMLSPAAGHGAVVVADQRVLGASPVARSRGIIRGMSLALARRRCPNLQVWAAADGALHRSVGERIGAWLGESAATRGGFLARLPASCGEPRAALDAAARLVRLLWQELGVECRVSVAVTAGAARGLAALLEPGWVGYATPSAADAWARPAPRAAASSAGDNEAIWAGAAMPDIEGVAARARILAEPLARAARGGVLRVRVVGARGSRSKRVRIPAACSAGGVTRLVESVVRREGAALGPISSLRITRLPPRANADESRVRSAVSPAEGATRAPAGSAPAADATRRRSDHVEPAQSSIAAAGSADPSARGVQPAGRGARPRARPDAPRALAAVAPARPPRPIQLALLAGVR